MKKTIILLLAPLFTYAQTDSVKVSTSEENGNFVKTEIIDNAEYILKRQEPINQLFKFQIGSTPNSRSSRGNIEFNVSAGYERKFGKSFSVNLMADYWKIDEGFHTSVFSLVLEPRYYLNQRVSNLSGMYVGVKAQKYFGNIYDFYQPVDSFKESIGVSWGMQNRFLNAGLIDIGITAGLQSSQFNKPIWAKADEYYYRFTGNYEESRNLKWFVRSEARIGLGISGIKSNYRATSCDVFKCFEAQNKWLKVNFTKMFYISESRKDIDLDLDYEFKLGQSAWSINQGFRLRYLFLNEERYYFNNGSSEGLARVSANSWSGAYSFSPRYYYNLKKRMAYGKSANNLSANYISSINGFDILLKSKYSDFGINKFHTGIVYGMQRRLVKNGYFDINAGVAKALDGTWVDSIFPRRSGLFLVLNFKVGYAFL